MDKSTDHKESDKTDEKKKEIDIMEMLHKKKMFVIESCFHETGGKGLTIE